MLAVFHHAQPRGRNSSAKIKLGCSKDTATDESDEQASSSSESSDDSAHLPARNNTLLESNNITCQR